MVAPASPESRRDGLAALTGRKAAGSVPLAFVGISLAILGTACALNAPSGEVVDQALEAQLGGPGVCSPIARRDTSSSDFFPGVRLVVGSCERQGEAATALVGVDGSGVVFLLGSRTGFNFLLTRHPPRGLDSTTVIAYALDALTMSGLVEPGAGFIETVGEIPDDMATEMRRSGQAFSPTRMLEARLDSWIVSLTTLSARRLANYWVAIDRETGAARASGETLWRRADG